MSAGPWLASETWWRKAAIGVTAGMLAVLVALTFDTTAKIMAGSARVPAYSVINRRIYYRHDAARGYQVPVIGDDEPLFAATLSEPNAEALVSLGKLTVQAKNCMNCHTLLGNGAYYAPDLTKAWLDPGWISEAEREPLLVEFLRDPGAHARTFATNRRMPNLRITEEEARGVVAFLKWMAAIDTNGFPSGFTPLHQEGDP